MLQNIVKCCLSCLKVRERLLITIVMLFIFVSEDVRHLNRNNGAKNESDFRTVRNTSK